MTKHHEPLAVEIIRSPRLEIATRVQDMDTPTLRAELARALTVTAETISYLAAIWRELEIRGEDLTDLRKGMGEYLPLIAAGQLDAEVVVRFAGRQSLIAAVRTLPIGEQKRLANGAGIPVFIGNGTTDSLKIMPALSLTRQQIALVFDLGRVRSPEEQENLLAGRFIPAGSGKKPQRLYQVRVDKSAGTIKVGNMTVPIDEVVRALRGAGMKVSG